MMAVLLIGGIGLILAGLLGIVFGIPVKEFSFGSTLILTGAIVACTGSIVIGLWTVLRELKNISKQLGHDLPVGSGSDVVWSAAGAASAVAGNKARNGGDFPFGRDQVTENADNADPAVTSTSPTKPPMPWHEEAASRDRLRSEAPVAPEVIEPEPAVKPRRNLMFSSSSRKERERERTRAADLPFSAELHGKLPPEPGEGPPAISEYARPTSEQPKPADAPPRSARAPSTFAAEKPVGSEAGAPGADRPPTRAPPATRKEDKPVTVLKSGVVDGMAYSLYSDGSIEAQMPEGMMRFASIDELRSHLDQRP